MTLYTVVCENLKKSFGATAVVNDVSFAIPSGKTLALLGPSGCGKTTTLRLIAGFEHLDNGRISIAEQVVADKSKHLPPEKRHIGMVFQDYAIFPHLSVAKNISFGLRKGKKAKQRTQEMLEMVGLQAYGDQMPHELSGGQQQRIALARALAMEPHVVLLDEPFSNLDNSLRVHVRHEVRELLKQSEATAVFVTHDQQEALFFGDIIGVMNAGKIEQIGTPVEVYHSPKTRYVAEFMGQIDFITGEVSDRGIMSPLGVVPQTLPIGLETAVSIGVRPHQVWLTATTEGNNGHIQGRQLVGMAYIYRIALTDGTIIHSWQPYTLDLRRGTAVKATFNPTFPLTCFHNGQAILPA